jgi:hypothetical protein
MDFGAPGASDGNVNAHLGRSAESEAGSMFATPARQSGEVARASYGLFGTGDLVRGVAQSLVPRLRAWGPEAPHTGVGTCERRFRLDERRRVGQMGVSDTSVVNFVAQLSKGVFEFVDRHPPGTHRSLRDDCHQTLCKDRSGGARTRAQTFESMSESPGPAHNARRLPQCTKVVQQLLGKKTPAANPAHPINYRPSLLRYDPEYNANYPLQVRDPWSGPTRDGTADDLLGLSARLGLAPSAQPHG